MSQAVYSVAGNGTSRAPNSTAGAGPEYAVASSHGAQPDYALASSSTAEVHYAMASPNHATHGDDSYRVVEPDAAAAVRVAVDVDLPAVPQLPSRERRSV